MLLFRLGKSEALGCWKEEAAEKVASQKEVVLKRRGPGKKVANILAGVQILEVGIDPGDQRATCGQMLGNVQRPWPVMPEAGHCNQLHSKNFLLNFFRLAMIFLWRGAVKAY